MNNVANLDQQGTFEKIEWNTTKLKDIEMTFTIPKIVIPLARGIYCGLWIEVKSEKSGTSKEEEQWIKKLNMHGYYATICYSWDDAKEIIQDYLYITIKN